MSRKGWLIFIITCIVLLSSLVWMSAQNKVDVSGIDPSKVQAASERNGNIGDHSFGKIGSKVVIIEYGDYQCPGCGKINPKVTELRERYKDTVQFIFRNMPLTQMHPNALAAAAAVEAAGLQGKFWAMHDLVYSEQGAWENLSGSERVSQFEKFARQLELDVQVFSKDMNSTAVTSKIRFDTALARKVGVTATPTLYLNGTVMNLDDWTDMTNVYRTVDSELQKFGITPPSE